MFSFATSTPISILSALVLSFFLTSCDARPVTSHLKEGSKSMSPSSSAETDQLSPNLVPYFSDPIASMVVARITGHQLTPPNNEGVQTGLVKFAVAKVIHSETLREGDSIETSLERISDPELRLHNMFNQWNALSLDAGETLLLSAKPDRTPKTFIALAAVRVSSVDDPHVAAAQECYRIELLTDNPDLKQQLLTHALEGQSDLLRFYALDVLTQRHGLSREASVRALETALNSEKVSPDAKRDMGFRLVSGDLFDETRGADPVNIRIVSAFAKQMVASKDVESREQWLGFLSSCILREYSSDTKKDREMRLDLVKSIRDPSPQQMISVLTVATRLSPGEDEAQPAKQLLDVWQSTQAPSR
jgi:hypothetical protein